MCRSVAESHQRKTGQWPSVEKPALFVSFEDGLSASTDENTLKVFFQNLLCPKMNVIVKYPLSHYKYQSVLWKSDVPHRWGTKFTSIAVCQY